MLFDSYRIQKALGVSVSGYHAWRHRGPSQRQLDDMVILAHIKAQFSASNDSYGSPRMHAELSEDGVKAGRNRIARLIRKNDLKARQGRRFRKTTDSDHGGLVAPDIPDPLYGNRMSSFDESKDFNCDGPDEKWGVGISYIRTNEGWLYPAIVVDLYSRHIVGWVASDRMKKAPALKALRRAIILWNPPAGLIHHPDRGSQYCSEDYRSELRKYGFIASMSSKGNCYDNAMVETVSKTIKAELVWTTIFQTRRDAEKAIGTDIDGFYNLRKRHSTLGYMATTTFEAIRN